MAPTKTKRTAASTSEIQPISKRTRVGGEGPQAIFLGLHPPGSQPIGETSIAPTDIDISPSSSAAASNDLTAINCDQWERQSDEILDCGAKVPESEDRDMRGEKTNNLSEPARERQQSTSSDPTARLVEAIEKTLYTIRKASSNEGNS